MARLTKQQIVERDEARASLREQLPPGSTVYTILRRVSSSGMCRHISVAIADAGEVRDITWQVARAMGETFQRDTGGIKVGGCGMDMGFHLVYSLSRTLYPEGFPVAGVGRNGDTSGHDNDGGYAIKSRWL